MREVPGLRRMSGAELLDMMITTYRVRRIAVSLPHPIFFMQNPDSIGRSEQ
jgi:hypothetical protein